VLRLSKKADYALIALSYMAAPGRRQTVTAREVAEQHAIPIELLAKVLQRLVRTGVLTSIQGIRGGYRLARPPRAISVAEVVEAIDGPLMLTACDDRSDSCEQYMKCSIRDPLHRIRERIASALHACSVAELAEGREPVDGPAQTVPVIFTPAAPARARLNIRDGNA
jgi:Rrf2 family protein